MKHTLPVTLILISVFLVAQLVGLGLLSLGTTVTQDDQGNIVVAHSDTALGPRPDVEGFGSFVYLIVGIAVGTIVLLILVRFRMLNVWKLWFFLAVWLASTVALGAFLATKIALVIALVLAAWKIWRPNVIIHNVTEVLVYSGISLLIAPILNPFYVSLLLIVIAIYDAYAVWKSKHMISMAQFQTESKLFAGLLVPYQRKTVKLQSQAQLSVKAVRKPSGQKNAILGGGDIAFPMLFTGVVFDSLVQGGMSKLVAFVQSSVITCTATLALLLLFFYAKQDEYYPAMPFIAAGCFVGYGIIWFMHLV